jgi:hypothetical protein
VAEAKRVSPSGNFTVTEGLSLTLLEISAGARVMAMPVGLRFGFGIDLDVEDAH